MHGAVLAAIALTVFMHDPAVAKRAATRASCVAACDATTGDCIAAAGASVTKKTQRRCRRKTLRRCVRTGLTVCPRPNPCPSTPSLVGTWEGTGVTCSLTCLVPETQSIEERPCAPPSTGSLRLTVTAQGPGCESFTITEPFNGVGSLDLEVSPITFTGEETDGFGIVPIAVRARMDGRIDGETLRQVTVASGSTIIPPGSCEKRLTAESMTRVAE